MNRIKCFFIAVLFSFSLFAQNDVTKFLGIPVDGYVSDMRKKLEAKGFVWDSEKKCLEGEFNGGSVQLFIVTNKNKVYRIMVADANYIDETNIKIRFNRLCSQFKNNDRYVSFDECCLSDNEDISYGISARKKRYEANFYQKPAQLDSSTFFEGMHKYLLEYFTMEQLADPTEEQKEEMGRLALQYSKALFAKKPVWFMIDEMSGEYRILMFYDNEYNHANGEDL